jgi:hypothetical protein
LDDKDNEVEMHPAKSAIAFQYIVLVAFESVTAAPRFCNGERLLRFFTSMKHGTAVMIDSRPMRTTLKVENKNKIIIIDWKMKLNERRC